MAECLLVGLFFYSEKPQAIALHSMVLFFMSCVSKIYDVLPHRIGVLAHFPPIVFLTHGEIKNV